MKQRSAAKDLLSPPRNAKPSFCEPAKSKVLGKRTHKQAMSVNGEEENFGSMSDFAMKVKPVKNLTVTPTFRAIADTSCKSIDYSLSSNSNKQKIKVNKIASTKTATPE